MSRFHVELHATGDVDPAEAWDRYARPARWADWSPQIRRVSASADRLVPGMTGRVHGPLGVSVPFVVDEVDEVARTWRWTVEVGPLSLELVHDVRAAADGGTRTGLSVRGAAPLVLGYAPLAQLALQRLVRAG